MKTLAFELSTARGSLAWLNDDVDPAAAAASAEEALVREWPNDRKDSGPFFENLADVRKQFGVPEKIIVGLGPGSYAGVRIAISAAIGLSFAGGTGSVPSQNLGRHGGRPSIELVGYPSICAMESNEREYCVIGDARRQSFFFARIRANELVEGPDLFSEIELRDKIDKLKENMSIFASEKLPQFTRAVIRYPSALVLARLARDSHRNFFMPPLEPIYLREPHITMPKR
jgi:tRNA A37 threonylcarbamoyladenosine modification protein TsaB